MKLLSLCCAAGLILASGVEAKPKKRSGAAKSSQRSVGEASDAEEKRASADESRDEDGERSDAEEAQGREEAPSELTRFESFCRSDKKLPKGVYVKKKLVLFPLEVGKGVKVTMGKDELVRAEAAGIFQLNYPMPRYRGLLVSGKRLLDEHKETISLDTLKTAMNSVELRELGCAEYAIVPLVTDFQSEKTKVETVDKKTGAKRTSEAWSIKLTVDAGIYKIDGEKGLRLHETVSATVPSALDLFADIGQSFASQVKGAANKALPKVDIVDVLKSYEHVTSVPQAILAGCADVVDKQLKDGLKAGKSKINFKKCLDKAQDATKSNLYQAAAKQNELKKCLENPPQNLDEQFLCELRNRSQQAALSLQLETKELDEFRLYGPLKKSRSLLGTPLGADEGVEVNHEFYIVEKRPGKAPKELGFVKVYEPGPGGIKGLKTASKLQLVSGSAKKSSPYITVEENPRRGIDVTFDSGLVPFAVPAMTLPNKSQDKVTAGSFAPALGAGIGFDLSNLTGIPELYEKTNIYYVVRDPFTSLLVHTGAEKRWLVSDSTYLSGGILAALSTVDFKTGNVTEETQNTTTTDGETGAESSSTQDVKKEEQASAQTYGTILQTGLSYRLGRLCSLGLQGGYQYMGEKLTSFKADSGEATLRDSKGAEAGVDLSGGFLMVDFYLHL